HRRCSFLFARRLDHRSVCAGQVATAPSLRVLSRATLLPKSGAAFASGPVAPNRLNGRICWVRRVDAALGNAFDGLRPGSGCQMRSALVNDRTCVAANRGDKTQSEMTKGGRIAQRSVQNGVGEGAQLLFGFAGPRPRQDDEAVDADVREAPHGVAIE